VLLETGLGGRLRKAVAIRPRVWCRELRLLDHGRRLGIGLGRVAHSLGRMFREKPVVESSDRESVAAWRQI